MRAVSRNMMWAAGVFVCIFCGCASVPEPPETPRATSPTIAPPKLQPAVASRRIVETTPDAPPLWYTDYEAWRKGDAARSRRTYLVATGEGQSEAMARRNALLEAASSRHLSVADLEGLSMAGTPYVVEYDDGSFKVTALYEWRRPRATSPTRAAAAEAILLYHQAVDVLCNDLIDQLDNGEDTHIETLGVSGFGYKTTPFPCEFSDFFEAELRRAFQRAMGDRAHVLDPALMKSESMLAVPDAAVGGTYWPAEDKRTVRVQARMTDLSTGELMGESSVNLSLGKMAVRVEPLRAGEAEKNLPAVEHIRSEIRQGATQQENFAVNLWLEGGRRAWRNGEKLVFRFRAERDCYLNLLHFDSSGKVQLLFPNQWHQDSHVKGQQELAIPSDAMAFDLEVVEPFGTEIVMAVATATPAEGLYTYRPDKDIGFRSIEGGRRGIAIKPTGDIADLPADQKAEAVLAFTTMP